MNTRQYIEQQERKHAKRITRHVLYQKVRDRAVKLTSERDTLQKKNKKLLIKVEELETGLSESGEKIKELTEQLEAAREALESLVSGESVTDLVQEAEDNSDLVEEERAGV